jgi:hypothetical protein
MINHFRTHLLNQPASFFTDSLFPVYTDAGFIPAVPTLFTRRVNNALFGEKPDATLLDYRFFQFLRIIRNCNLSEHVRRFDSRETYTENDYDFTDPLFFTPIITPMTGLRVQEIGSDAADTMRILLKITRNSGDNILVLRNNEALLTVSQSDTEFTIPALGLKVTTETAGTWLLDFRRKGIRELPGIISSALSFSEDTYTSIFDRIRDDTPEYEKGFYNVTDKLHRFCMLLFAQAVLIEKLTMPV